MSGSRTIRELRRALRLCICAALLTHTLAALDPNRTLGQYIVARWGRDSFPGGAINAIAQTPDGFLWIGAEKGLVRFDGISFRLIDHSNSPTLPPGRVLGLAVDPEGVLWVRMQSPYLMRYRDGNFEQIYPAQIPPPFTDASQSGATAVTRGVRGDTLMATPGEALRYIGGKFTPIASSGEVRGIPTSIAETADGAVWVGMRDTGLFCVRDRRGSQVGLPDQKVNVLLPAAGSQLWIGTDSGLLRWDGSAITHRGVPSALSRSPILALARDRDSNLWISTPAGITRMDSQGPVLHGSSESTRGEVHAIFEDREGNVWFGGTQGLMQLRDAPFLSYTGVADEGGSLYIDTSGRAWIAPSSGGLLWIRGAEHHVITNLGMDGDVIYSMSGGGDELWAGRRLGGVTELREEDGVLQAQTYTARDGLASGVVDAVYRAHDGSVWAGTLSGAVSRIEKGRITTFTTANGLSGDAVTTIQETPDGVIWAGTAGGLEAFRNGNWRRYGGEDGSPPGRVNSLALDGDGKLWVGSSSGLCYWSGSRFENARYAPESLQGEIYGLAADEYGTLWAATDSQVVSIGRAFLLGQSPGPAVVRQFGVADGLPSTEGIRLDHSVVKGPSGRIWFSLRGGLCVVNPSHPSALAPALVNVESVTVDGRPLGAGPARYPSSGRRVVFNFIGVSLTMPGRVRYRYRLDGYDSDWSQPSESREAAYTNLAPARYTFRVIASNSEGLWNGAPASVPLEVEPQLSETWWFRVSVLCLALAAIFAGFRYRLARVHAAMNLRFEERLAERTRIAQELHDTLLQGFLSASMQVHVAADSLPAGSPAKPTLTRALQLMRQVIEEGRNAVRGLRSSGSASLNLEQAFLHVKREFVSDETSTRQIGYRVVVKGEKRTLHPLLRDEIYRIGREALINAFRHSRAQRIEVELNYFPSQFSVLVRDDGCGIEPRILKAGRDGHWGLSGMRERAEQIGARFHVYSSAAAGTQVELTVPGHVAFQSDSTHASRWFAKWNPLATGNSAIRKKKGS